MWTSILPLGLWVQHLEWYLVLKEQIIHTTCCYFYHLITVFMTHFYNKLWRNNSPPFKENENLQLGYAALLWPMTAEYFQDRSDPGGSGTPPPFGGPRALVAVSTYGCVCSLLLLLPYLLTSMGAAVSFHLLSPQSAWYITGPQSMFVEGRPTAGRVWAALLRRASFLRAKNVFILECALMGGARCRGLVPPSPKRWSRLKA